MKKASKQIRALKEDRKDQEGDDGEYMMRNRRIAFHPREDIKEKRDQMRLQRRLRIM